MNRICKLQNSIQNYAWGSHTAIADLLGLPSPSEKPQAELWMGSHPKAPSRVRVGEEWRSLSDVVTESPVDVLGARVAERFDGKLPFLFKVLAAAQPLSIQAHPTLEQARRGFARENERGIPLDAPNRNYRDDNHKPEIICALTPFWGINGFRRVGDIVSAFRQIAPAELSAEVETLAERPDSAGLERFFGAIMTMDADRQRRAVSQVVEFARGREGEDPIWDWIVRLDARYPGDVGVLSPVLLNVVLLEPGRAMLSHAGQLHAYLDGVGIELMANSDNVLRGGLTPKHVDVPELLDVLTFAEKKIDILAPGPGGVYPSDVEEFRLSVITVREASSFAGEEDHGVEIWICTSGEASVSCETGHDVAVTRGTSFIVPAAAPAYRIAGDATLYRASVP
jgi:mannose-6-phosphate isomerase